jgi:predicted Zn-dependent protease with MMP-like domain
VGGREQPPATLGIYEGTPLTERGHYYGGVLPDRITIYRNPTLRICDTVDDVIDEVHITVVHETAHHFGIDDARLHELVTAEHCQLPQSAGHCLSIEIASGGRCRGPVQPKI